MAKRETILETRPSTIGSARSGTITTVIGNIAIVGVATLFNTELQLTDIITWTDDAGLVHQGTVATIVDDLNLTLVNPALTVATGVSYQIQSVLSPYFIENDPSNDYGLPKNRMYNANVADAGDVKLRAPGTQAAISFEEGILIKSIYIRLPYQFTIADENIKISLFAALDSAGGNFNLPELGTSGSMMLPIENTEIEVNTYIAPPANAVSGSDNWSLAALIPQAGNNPGAGVTNFDSGVPNVSSINTPTVLDGQYLPIIVGVRIVHFFPLTVPT